MVSETGKETERTNYVEEDESQVATLVQLEEQNEQSGNIDNNMTVAPGRGRRDKRPTFSVMSYAIETEEKTIGE